MKQKIKQSFRNYPELLSFLKGPINWIYCAYLTLRFVDKYDNFPAFRINGSVKVRFRKHRSSKLVVKGKLIFDQWLNGEGLTVLTLCKGAELLINNDFLLGNGIKIYLGPDAKGVIKGKAQESASGITANSVVMIHHYLEIGFDCIIAWDTFLTDCDWHGIDGKKGYAPTIIGDHVWIGVGVKILKGVTIKKNAIISSNSVVVGQSFPEDCLIGGIPARILKEGIGRWHREMHDADRTFLKYN